jgi:ubiquinone/menaquinone biosynthesis C-methylase UbiE
VAGERDRWADWLLVRRHGGDEEALRRTLERLGPVRERVLDGAGLGEGDVVLDVGAGDGLIAFGALERVGAGGRVIFSDVSRGLLGHSRALAEEAGVVDRCEFVEAAAQDLAAIDDESVDAVTTRSTVIYVPRDDKPRAFAEFFRVLRPGGRLSSWEPVNRFADRPAEFCGIEATPILPLLEKLFGASESDPASSLVDFDERDLLTFAEEAGFADVRLAYEARIVRGELAWDAGELPWETFARTAPNPHAATLAETMERALTPAERAELEGYLRPRYEARAGTHRSAIAHLVAVKR